MLSLRFSSRDGIHSDCQKKLWTKPRKLVRKWIHFFWRKCHHFDFRQGMGFTRTFEKNGEKIGENWSEIEFTSFVENAITTIFDNGGDSLRFSKKMVKKTAKIGQKKNSVSYLFLKHDIYIIYIYHIWTPHHKVFIWNFSMIWTSAECAPCVRKIKALTCQTFAKEVRHRLFADGWKCAFQTCKWEREIFSKS